MNGLSNAIFGEHGFFEMTLKEMKRHRDNLDENNPMDFLGNNFSLILLNSHNVGMDF